MSSKEPFIEKLRSDITQHIAEPFETERASVSRTDLSFSSKTCPARHVWISAQWPGEVDSRLLVDLEDWSLGESPDDRTELHIDLEPDGPIISVVRDWLRGTSEADMKGRFPGVT